MTNAKTTTTLQCRAPKRLLRVIWLGLAVLVSGSCSGYFMTSPPIQYVSVKLLTGTPESSEGSTIEWTVSNNSTRNIVWMEFSFALYSATGTQFPAFGNGYFTARVSTELAPADQVTLAASLEPHVVFLPDDARVGLFFVRSVRFSDGTMWWNDGSYRYQGRDV